MDVRLVPHLLCPSCAAPALRPTNTTIADDRTIASGTLTCPSCGKRSYIRDGIWHAMGPHHAPRTLAQLSNVIPPTPQLYERVWRVRSLSLLSRRRFPNLEELSELTDALQPAADGFYLDVGCSEGLYARHLAATGANVVGLDHSVAFLRRARKRAASIGVRVSLVRAVAQHLPFATGTFSGVCMGASLNEIGDQECALGEMGRVTAPDGRFFSMHLRPAQRPAGRVLQALVRPSGIGFPKTELVHQWLTSAQLIIVDERTDGVVARVSATKERPGPTAGRGTYANLH